MADTMLAMLDETGRCRTLLNTAFVSAMMENGRIASVTLSNRTALIADYYIDSTGDGLVCLQTGCRTMSGQESRDTFDEPDAPAKATPQINGVSLLYRVTPRHEAGVEALSGGVSEKCWWAGSFPVAAINHYPNGDLNINMLPTMEGAEFMRLGYDRAREECIRRVHAHWHHLQSSYAEFRNFRLLWIAPALGIRESRQDCRRVRVDGKRFVGGHPWPAA